MKRGLTIVAALIVLLLLGGGWMFANSPDVLNQQLLRAIQEKQSAAQLEALLARGANPNYIFSPPLDPRLEPSLIEKVSAVIGRVETHRMGFSGISLLTVAYANENTVAVDVLLNHKADPNLCLSTNEDLPLWWVVKSQDIDQVKKLLAHGADPNLKKHSRDITPLQLAEQINNPALIALLKKASPPK